MNASIPGQYRAEISDCFKRYQDQLYRRLFWRTDCDREQAEDLVQQVMMEVAIRWEDFRLLGEESMTGLVYRIADRRAIDARRRYRVVRDHTCPMPPEHLAASGNGTEETVIGAMTMEHFIVIMRSLPGRQAHAARLYWLAGLSNAEIARELEITPGAVSHLLGKARARFKAELGSYLSEPDGPKGTKGGAGA